MRMQCDGVDVDWARTHGSMVELTSHLGTLHDTTVRVKSQRHCKKRPTLVRTPPPHGVCPILTQAPIRKALPNLTYVLATCQTLIRLQDHIASIKEQQQAWLYLHALGDKLQQQRVPVLGNQWQWLATSIIYLRVVEVVN